MLFRLPPPGDRYQIRLLIANASMYSLNYNCYQIPYHRVEYSLVKDFRLRGCLHDTGATFIQARVHSGSLLWLFIRLHDTKAKCHAGASHTGASSPRFLCRSEIFIPARKFIPVSCKRGMTVSYSLKFHQFLRPYKTRTPTNTALCNKVQLFISPRNAPLSCKHPLTTNRLTQTITPSDE